MWSWLLHRATGIGVLLFLVIHVLDTAALVWSPEFYDHALGIYKSPLFRFAELLIFFSVLFHAANGLRIIVQDFRPIAMRHQRRFAWAAGVVVVLVMLPVSWIMLGPLFGLRDEPGTARHAERCLAEPMAPACLEVGQ
jgi:succinate dehydrogenase / fumarate reductase cytochrome b subunit